MVWVNGKVSEHVAVGDRSFQYGDGCFTTILTCHGQIQRWELHLERMRSCIDALGMTQPDWTLIEQWLAMAILPDAKAGLKLHVSRGSGGRGYSPAQVSHPNVTISNFAFPEHYIQWQQSGIKLGICQRKMGLNPLLAGHKHNNRLEQVLLKAEMEQHGFSDGICVDLRDYIVETTMANVFWFSNGQLFTPDLTMAGVAGTARKTVLELCSKLEVDAHIGHHTLQDIKHAEEVFVSNAIMGIVPVCQIGEQEYSIGNQTRRLQENFHSC